jgi:hypothetical protein
MREKRKYLVLTVIAGLFFAPVFAAAASSPIQISPILIDEKGKPRDIFKESITITNVSDHKIELYPSVHNVNPDEGQQKFTTAHDVAEQQESLANWIELSRGVIELGPGEKRTVDFIIRIDLRALPGKYHASISFAEGWTRPDAESNPPAGPVMVNLEVESDSREVMQLNKFTSDNVVFTGDDVLFKYQLQNIGNQELQPSGEIRIYDRKGLEVAAIDVNREGKTVTPDQTAQLASVWSAVNGFGKFKALLTVNYGKGQTAAVQDTVYFWIIPWKQLLMLFAATLTAVIILVMYFHRWFEERHLGKLAHAGLLKVEAFAHIHHTTAEEPIAPVAKGPAPKKWKSLLSFWKRSETTAVEMPIIAGSTSLHETKGMMLAQHGQVVTVDQAAMPASPHSMGGTIDLKQLRVQRTQSPHSVWAGTDGYQAGSASASSPHVEIQGSVINLRRKNQ